jgi:glucose-1-phosphate adenylyltransferase
MFKTEVLEHILTEFQFDDFGGQVLPHAIDSHNVYGFDFDDFWADIGTIRSFYETNLLLTLPNPPFNLFDANHPIYTHPRFLPGSTVQNSVLENVMLAEGSCIHHAEIRHSIVGVRSQIRQNVKIMDSIIMGADYYDAAQCSESDVLPNGNVAIGIGSGCHIEGAIIDKNAHIGHDVMIKPFPRGTELDGPNWSVRDGIVVIPKGAVLQAGTIIAP